MGMYAEILMAMQAIAEKYGEGGNETETPPQTVDEWKAQRPTLQEEFSSALQDIAAQKRRGERH